MRKCYVCCVDRLTCSNCCDICGSLSRWVRHQQPVSRHFRHISRITCTDPSALFEVRQTTATRGHPYKLFKPHCTSNVRSSFFTQHVINVWNDLPTDIVNFYAPQLYRQVLLRCVLAMGILSVCLSVCHDPVVYQAQMR